jgi:hypothetical protein
VVLSSSYPSYFYLISLSLSSDTKFTHVFVFQLEGVWR